ILSTHRDTRSRYARRCAQRAHWRSKLSLNYSAMMVLVAGLMGSRLHHLIKVVRVDLQAKHRLHVFACLCNVGWAIVSQVLYVFEPMLHLLPQGVSEYADQRIRRADLDRFFGHRDYRSAIKASRFKSGVRRAFSGPVQPHGCLVEIEIS